FSQERQEGNADLSGGETQEKAGEDEMIDLPGPSGIGGKNAPGTEAPCSRYREDDVAELGEHVPDVAPVPPVGNPLLVGPGKMTGDLLLHLVFQDPGNRAPRCVPVFTRPFVLRCEI